MEKRGQKREVKMNRATQLRMERSNPYIYYQKQVDMLRENKSKDESIRKANLNQTVEKQNFKPKTTSTIRKDQIQSRYMDVHKKIKEQKEKENSTRESRKDLHLKRKILPTKTQNPISNTTKPEKKPEEVAAVCKPINKPRRSISAVHFHRCKISDVAPFKKPDDKKKVEFKTPIRESPEFNKRRSVSFSTPGSIRKTSHVTPVPRPTNVIDMKNKLDAWLEQKGKPLGSFHHLKHFGVHILPSVDELNEEDKENYEMVSERHASYEDLRIEGAQKTATKDLFTVAKDALYDLQKLILEGYPRDCCELWLELIKSKYQQLEEQPQYWECRAALEEMRGNFSSAVDCYQKAIINGAKVEEVDDSLEHLLKKFSLLNLSPYKNNTEKNTDNEKKKRETQLLDARNVFKSTIINFAIQKKTFKNKTEQSADSSYQFVATPVRRSSRLSRGNLTPGLMLCSTLQSLDDATRNNLIFKTNRALN